MTEIEWSDPPPRPNWHEVAEALTRNAGNWGIISRGRSRMMYNRAADMRRGKSPAFAPTSEGSYEFTVHKAKGLDEAVIYARFVLASKDDGS